ncbi:MAG: ATP-binding protein [Lactococcus lactis]
MKKQSKKNCGVKNRFIDFHDNLVLMEDRSVYAIYGIPSAMVSQIDEEGRTTLKDYTASALNKLTLNKNFELYRYAMDLNLFPMFETLSKDFSEDTQDLAIEICNTVLSNLEDSFEYQFDYKYYLVVPLRTAKVSSDLKASFDKGLTDLKEAVSQFFSKSLDYPVNWYEEFETIAQDMSLNLSYLSPVRLKVAETIFVSLHPYLRGLTFDKDFEVNQVKNSIINFERPIDVEAGHVISQNAHGKSYSENLPVVYFPKNIAHLHFLELLNNFTFPIDVSVKAYFEPTKGSLSITGQNNRASKRFKNTIIEADDADSGQKNSVMEAKYLSDDLKKAVDAKQNIISYFFVLTPFSKDLEELERRVNQLMEFCAQYQIELGVARTQQASLFFENFPCQDKVTGHKNYRQVSTVETFCEHLFFVDTRLGERVGFLLGRLDQQIASWRGEIQSAIDSSNNLVFTNPFLANKQKVKDKVTNNLHFGIVGETGGGKSFLAKLLFIYCSLIKSRVLYIDPKAEMRKQFEKVRENYLKQNIFPEVVNYINSINFVTLDPNDSKNAGALDPFNFCAKPADCADLAESMVAQLINSENNENLDFFASFKPAIDLFIEKRNKGERVGMRSVFRHLTKDPDESVAKTANYLLAMSNDSMLSLSFSEGSNDSVKLDSRITVVEIKGLDLPNEGMAPTRAQKKSLVVMYALGYFCIEFGSKDKKETIEFFDEAWFFKTTPVGRQVLKRMKRVGRSENNALGLITQSVKDFESEDDDTSFGKIFAFTTPNKLDETLNFMRVPVTKYSKAWFKNCTMGQCIALDIFGKTGRMSVECPYDGLFPLLETVQSELVSTDNRI